MSVSVGFTTLPERGECKSVLLRFSTTGTCRSWQSSCHYYWWCVGNICIWTHEITTRFNTVRLTAYEVRHCTYWHYNGNYFLLILYHTHVHTVSLHLRSALSVVFILCIPLYEFSTATSLPFFKEDVWAYVSSKLNFFTLYYSSFLKTAFRNHNCSDVYSFTTLPRWTTLVILRCSILHTLPTFRADVNLDIPVD